jgi:hypothetical protein
LPDVPAILQVFGDPDWPNIYTSEQLMIWTQAAFNNTQVSTTAGSPVTQPLTWL